MKPAANYRVVLVTAPDLKTARGLAQAALRGRLAACANLVPGIESHYWWKARLERSREVLLILKTTSSRVAQLETMILTRHPYDTPEFITLSPGAGSRRYLDWISATLKAEG